MRMSDLEIEALMAATQDRHYWRDVRQNADSRFHERLAAFRERRSVEGVNQSLLDEFASIQLDVAFQEVLAGLAVEHPADH